MTMLENLKKMWIEFSNMPINSNDKIDVGFYCWEKGVHRFEIWHWFNGKLPNGLANMQFKFRVWQQ